MKKIYLLSLLIVVFSGLQRLKAQVNVSATSGTLTGTYTTLRAAFDAINIGTHKGDIIIDISGNTNEGATPATLNSGDADPTSFSSLLIEPVVDGVTISGNPGAGFGVIQLNGADNVVIYGDNPNTAGDNRNLTIANTSAASAAYTSVIRLATRPTAVTGTDNNFIINCILTGNVTSGNASGTTATTSSANTSFGIYCGGNAGTTSALPPVAIVSETANPAAAGTTINNLVIDNNQIIQVGRGIGFNGAASTVSSSLTITRNIIGGSTVIAPYPYTAPASTVYSKGIWVAGTDAVSISGNTIQNILSYLSTSIVGIELNSAIGSSLIDISGNTITRVVNNSANNDAFGVLISSASNKFTITGNTISVVENSATTSVAGIKIATAGGQAVINQNKVSGINSRNTGGYGAFGIQLATAANGAEINNNFVFDIMNVGSSSFNNTDNAAGIIIGSGINHKIYHNSISLYGANSGAGPNLMSCLHVTSNSITGLDIRNNIFSNTVTSAGVTDAHVCLYLPFSAAGMGYTINNNAYYTGGVSGKHGIAHVIATSYTAADIYDVAGFNPLSTGGVTNFRNYSSAMGNSLNDFASFGSTAPAPFTSVTDLHIPAATSTRLESGGTPVGIAVDIDNAARSGSAPDIGADEFVGTPQDLTPPLITYTPLAGTCTLGNRTLSATIKDASGVPTSGGGLPVLYYKINAGAYIPVTGVSAGGGIYNFTFGGAAIVGDVVSYYIVAQDNAATPNVISNSSVGAGPFTATPPAATTPPTTPDSYGVQNALAPGSYTVGIAGAYPTLTAAVNAYNTSCLSGPVTFLLKDATYPSETFPIVIGNPVASAVNTLTIKPNVGITATISGASPVALIKLNGADYVTIDGSNSGGTSQNLTITNTDPGTSSAVIWVASASSTNGATNNTVKNCIITGNASTTTFGGIISSGGVTIATAAETANTNNTYQNNNITTVFVGIGLYGAVAGDNANTISNSKIGSVNVPEKLGFRGIYISNQNNVSVTNNNVLGIASNINSSTTRTEPPGGIIVKGVCTNGIINSNNISDITNSSTGGWPVHGLTLGSSTANTGLKVYNNFIRDVFSYGWPSIVSDNGHGIGIISGGGYNIYYNSVNLSVNQGNPSGTISSAIYILSGAGQLTIKNNIFSNQQTSNVRYSIYSEGSNTAFTLIDNNDYYTTGASLGFISTTRANLAAWQSGTGADGNSVSVDPVFISSSNLHLKTTSPSSTLNGQALPVAGIPLDIDGDIRNLTTPDIGADEFTPDPCGGVITAGTVTASQTSVCVSAGVVFASTAFSTGTGMTYQWESSPDNASWSPIPGETNPSGVNIAISTTIYIRLSVTCTLTSTTASSGGILVTVNNPTIVSSAGASVCGQGTVGLSATGSAGTTVYWYSALTGGTPLASGAGYTTPLINATTTYYAEAVAGASLGTAGPASPTAQGGTIGTQTVSWEVYFDVIQATTLISVDVFPITSGQTSTLNVYNSADVLLASIPYTTTVSGGATAQTIPINIALPIGAGYYLYAPGGIPSSGLSRNTSNGTYPYTSSAINITGNGFTQDYYMCYYNFQFSSGCPSAPRTAIVATVTPPPAFTLPTATPATVCESFSSNLNATDADYTGYSWAPTLGLSNPLIANPVATPAATTTYTVTATDGTCTTSADITITVNPIPGVLTITPAAATVCIGATQILTASGGAGNFFRERFEAFPISKFTVTGTGLTESQNSTYYQEGTKSVLLNYSNFMNTASPGSYEMTNDVNLSLYSNSVLTFQHICATESNGSADWDFGYVEYSTDGGTNWTAFPSSSYTGSGTLKNGVVSFDKSSYADWNAQFTTSGSTPGAGPATALWKLETIDLSAWQSSTQFKVRFRIKSDASVVYYGWLIDDVKLNGQASITWAPITELYTDPGATIAYGAGTNHPVVYTKPSATNTYVATASFGTCSVTKSVVATVTSNPISLTIAAAPSTTICGGDTVDLSITAQNIQGSLNPLYDWRLNGTTITGSATAGSSVGTTVTVASTATLYPGMKVTVTAGVGAFAIDTRIVAILSSTQFTISAVPIAGLAGATISATASGKTVTTLRFGGLSNGDVITCALTVGGVSCVPVNPVTSNSISFTVNPTTATSVSIAALPGSTICAGTSVTFTATPVNGGAAPTYEWFINGTSQGAPALANTFTSAALTNGQVVTCRMISNALNCPFPKAPLSAGITMTVNPSFPVSVTITSVPAPSGTTVNICNGTSVTFTATPTNGGVTPTYQWYVGAVPVGVNSPTYTTNTLADLDLVTCVVTSSLASCAIGNPATSNTLDIAVTSLTASVTITPVTAVCAGTSKTFTATPTNGGGTPSYQWYVNALPVGANLPTYTYTPVNGDVIAVDMTTSLSCATPVPATTSITQTVNANPTASIPGSPGTLCNSGTIPFLMNGTLAAGSGTISTIQWRLGGVNVAGATAADYATLTPGSYDVVVFNSNGCSVTSAPFVLNPAGPVLMSGAYTIGAITATGASSVGTTITVATTANLVTGALLSKVSGVGTFAANTVITSIVNGTTFTVNNTPTVALSGAAIAGTTCTNYPSFVSAITDLNTRSINGACTFNVTPGYVENLSAKMVALGNATLNAAAATRSITFQKNGAGVNPKIVAYTGGTATPASNLPDGIFTISGTDNVTIDAIDLEENAANVANPATMEYGYGLFKLAAGDGVQNNTIKNCTVTLNRTNNALGVTPMGDGSVGILLINATPTGAITALTPTNGGTVATNGSNSSNKFYANTIQNCNTGIYLSGYPAVAGVGPAPTATSFLGDLGNDVGGAILANGNTIQNFGSGGANSAVGIRATNQWSANLSYNTINNNVSITNHAGALRGISAESGTSASATINNNVVTVKGGGTTTAVVGIANGIGATAAANTVQINNNSVTGTYNTATTGTLTGISNTALVTNLSLNTNQILNLAMTGTGTFIGIENTAAIPGTYTVNSNTITGNSKNGTGTMTLIAAGAPTTNLSINSNNISNNTVTGGGAAVTLNCIINTGTSTYTVNSNTISNNSVTGMSGAAVATILGYTNSGGLQNETVSGNTISNLFVTGTSTGVQIIRGITHNTSATATRTVSLNTVFNLYSSAAMSAAIAGIQSQLGGTVTISRNWIYNLFPGQSITAGSFAKGIAILNGTAVTASNNMIALDLSLAAATTSSVATDAKLTGANSLIGIDMTSAAANTAINLYFNSIRLAGTGAAGFGSSAVFHTASATATTAALTMTNNILDNESTPNGGLAVAYRRSAGGAGTLANYAGGATNLFYAGTPGANNLIYSDGTSSAQTLAAYTGGVFTAGTIAPRDAASQTDATSFFSQTDLHVNVADNCAISGTGTAIAITVDFDNALRSSPPDIGADEFVGTGTTGTWAGVNTNWNDPLNWCGGVPTAASNVTIPTAPNYPNITGITALANNITITGSGTITVAATGTLKIAGAIVSTPDAIDATAGTVEFSGTAAQTLRANYFNTANIAKLVNSNTSAGGLTIDNTGAMLNITNEVNFGANNNQKLNTSNLLTLRSTATATARIADVTLNSTRTGNDVVGKVVIERYVPAKRAWRLLTAPVKSSTLPTPTIYNNWQESSRSFPLGTLADPVPGYGTHVSFGNNVGTFDQNNTNNASIFYLTATGWNGVPTNTSLTGIGLNQGVITDQPAYMLFVRGDRSTNLALGTNAPASPTTLRTTGDINVTSNAAAPLVLTGTGALPTGPNFSYVFSNPYPSAISFEKIFLDPLNAGMPNTFYVWDANITGSNGVGGWITVTRTGVGTYVTAPISVPSLLTGEIQSGMAFAIVYPSGPAPLLRYKEAFKVSGSNISLYRPTLNQLRTTLIAKNADGTASVNDGTLICIGGAFDNKADKDDANKMLNFTENISMVKGDIDLSIEKRSSISDNDTVFFKFSKMKTKSYSLAFDLDGMGTDGKTAILEDLYLGTKTILDMEGSTSYDFSVVLNTPSADPKRFRIVFKKLVQYSKIDAHIINSDVSVDWNVNTEFNIHHYVVERSADGNNYDAVGTQLSTGNVETGKSYSLLDLNPAPGVYYYRIKCIGNNGAVVYSDRVKMTIVKGSPAMFVFPNPVTNNVIGLQMNKMPAGVYETVLMSEDGKVINRGRIAHAGGTSTESIRPKGALINGSYRLEVIAPDKTTSTLSVIVQTR